MKLNDKIIKLFSLTEDKYHGISEDRIVSTEKKLNIKLPEALRDFYLTFGKNKKLNINDELFRVKDIYIENDRFLVFGKTHFFNILYGIAVSDLQKKNPCVYEKRGKRDEKFKFFYEWIKWDKSISNFLLKVLIQSGLDGGLKYRFNFEKGDELIDITIPKLNFTEIKNISGRFIKYYTNHYRSILETMWNKDKMDYLCFGTEHKEIFQEISVSFINNGINIEKLRTNYSKNFEIFSENPHGPIVKFFPGKYNGDYSKKRNDAIFLHEDAVNKFQDLLIKSNKAFDIYGISTNYNKNQINTLIDDLCERLNNMTNNRKFHFTNYKNEYDYYSANNIEFRRYKKQIIILFTGLIEWLKNVKTNTISILGI